MLSTSLKDLVMPFFETFETLCAALNAPVWKFYINQEKQKVSQNECSSSG